jgi:hypothetical protein
MLVLGCVAGCVESPAVVARVAQPGDELVAHWSAGVNSLCADCAPRAVVLCDHVVSHPCPYLAFTTRLGIEGDEVVFGSATGGATITGIPAENMVPSRDPLELDDAGDMLLPQRGDDGGLRHPWMLHPTATGYVGDLEYTLDNVAGWTTFHVELAWR